MSGAGEARNDRRFFCWIYRVSDAAARANWLHSLIHKASINRSDCSCFSIKAGTCIKKRKPRFNNVFGKCWFDGDFFVRNQDAIVELRLYQSLPQSNIFLFLTEWYSFFLLWACFSFSFLFLSFLSWTFFRFWFFHGQRFVHKQRASTCEFGKVRDVNKIWK